MDASPVRNTGKPSSRTPSLLATKRGTSVRTKLGGSAHVSSGTPHRHVPRHDHALAHKCGREIYKIMLSQLNLGLHHLARVGRDALCPRLRAVW